MRRALKVAGLVLLAVVLLQVTGCMTNTHVVGQGPAGDNEVTKAQWYVLWGLVQLNEVDTQDMVEGATNYRIETSMQPLDVIINAFTSVVTVVRRSVSVAY